ncbi:DUF4334 domain-containing protein [Asticcacaulis tiandongensis]|uniref:DUF4334 domain-containing protein n=1 Tax=Asticcacaulis tiandongensis TaxID=2565365 RepID=UPI00112A330C|nr:DUF4334 domain-containing protein [Asticcacaulis tiandongensis]
MLPEWLRTWQTTPLDTAAGLRHFDSLPAVQVSELNGDWLGSGLHTQHPLDGLLERYGWYGKAFHTPEVVDPLLFSVSGKIVRVDPARVPLGLALKMPRLARHPVMYGLFKVLHPLIQTSRPRARLRLVVYRGATSAAMIYDHQPITDHFRRIDERHILGLMDLRGALPFFFLLSAGPPLISITR